MIRSVHFKNFRVLQDAELPLGRFTLIVGPNGSGKSTALQAISALKFPGLGLEFGRILSAGIASQNVQLRVNWAEPYEGSKTTFTWKPNGGFDLQHDPPLHAVELHSFFSRIRLFALSPSAIATPTALYPRAELQPNGAQLAVVLDRLRDEEPERFEALNLILGRWLPEFDAILFETPETGQRALALRTRDGHHTIPASSLSDGTLLALAMLTLAYLPEPPSMVCLEEPDHGIHPRLLREVKDALHRLSYPEGFGESRKPVSVVATTHSPYLLDLFKDHPEEIVIAHRVGLEARFERLSTRPDIDEILADSHLGDVWYSGILGGVPPG